MKPKDNASNMKNANKGSDGVNRQYSQTHGNRGKQMQTTPGGSGSRKSR